MIDLNDMIIFARVVDAGSISGAARDLATPKSTVSRRIRQLEESLGVRLLQRTTRSLKLTELGATFYERCKRVREEVEEAERSVSLGQEKPRGVLRISGPVESGVFQLGSLIAEYSRLYPEVQVELDLSNRFVDIVEEGYDLAIRAGELPDSTLVARRLRKTRMVPCASPGYLSQHDVPKEPDELKQHRLVLYGNSLQKKSYHFRSEKGIATVQLEPFHCANSMSVVKSMTLSGIGISLLPDSHVYQEVADGSLVLIMQEWKLPENGIYAVYPSPRHLTPKVRSFIDFLSTKTDLNF